MDKWFSDLPKRGWVLHDVIEVDYGDVECDFCGTEIKYIHEILHSNIQEHYFVGCICAGKLTEDYVGSQLAESSLKKWITKRKRWINSPRWKMADSGNIYRKDDSVLIFKANNSYKLKIYEDWGRRFYSSMDLAKQSAFLYLYPKPKLGA